MEISYNKDGNRSTMLIKDISIDEDDYKLQMILKNHIDGIIPISIERINNQSSIAYNISSKAKLTNLYARKQMSGKELYSFIKDIKLMSERIKEYLLDINCISFDVEMIYFNRQTGKYEFCYIPQLQGDFQISIRDLFDKLLEYINHNDKDAVMIAYGIQQLTMGGDFTLQDLLMCAYDNMRISQQNDTDSKASSNNIEVERANIEEIEEKSMDEIFHSSARQKKGLWCTLQKVFRKKEKYDIYDEMEKEDYYGNESMVVSEEQEPYNQNREVEPLESDERTMLLTGIGTIKPVVLTAMKTETPIKIKPLTFPYIVGKSRCSCDFCIDSAVVSRVHMRIIEELDDFLVEDLNSTNGTFLNGERLEGHKPHPIEVGDKLTIANIDFLVE